MVEADILLLIGNSTLKKAKVVLHIAENKVKIIGTKINMMETSSGHFRIAVRLPKNEKHAQRKQRG